MKEKVAIYARLSREDEDKIDGNIESRSIESQISILSAYALEHSFEIYKIYYDDGVSGATLERKQFQELLDDASKHRFNVLLIKDISRLGRVMHHVGKLIEQFFPENKIRVISLNDNYDSATYKDDESIVLRNFLNAYYLKDFKRKCKKSLIHRANTIHLCYYPKYGYKFDEDRNELVDEYSSKIVQMIFHKAKEGQTLFDIAKWLNEQKILTRSRYAVEVLKMKPLNKKSAKLWNASKVYEIIKDIEYCGHCVNLKKHEEPIILKDKHTAIIDEDTFYEANKQINKRNTRGNCGNHIGSLLKDKKTNHNFSYTKKRSPSGKDKYTSKYTTIKIEVEVLYKILFDNLCHILDIFLNDEKKFHQFVINRFAKISEIDIKEINEKVAELNNEYSILLENYFNNKVKESVFNVKALNYREEIENLEKLKLEYTTNITKIELAKNRIKKVLCDIDLENEDRIDLFKKIYSKIVIDKNNKNEFSIDLYYVFDV